MWLESEKGEMGTQTGFPGGSGVKNLPAKCRRHGKRGFSPGSGRSPGVGKSNPLHYSGLENSMDRGAWWATVEGLQSQTRLSVHRHWGTNRQWADTGRKPFTSQGYARSWGGRWRMEQIFVHRSQKELGIPGSWTSGLQNCESIHFYPLNPAVCDTLLQGSLGRWIDRSDLVTQVKPIRMNVRIFMEAAGKEKISFLLQLWANKTRASGDAKWVDSVCVCSQLLRAELEILWGRRFWWHCLNYRTKTFWNSFQIRSWVFSFRGQ